MQGRAGRGALGGVSLFARSFLVDLIQVFDEGVLLAGELDRRLSLEECTLRELAVLGHALHL